MNQLLAISNDTVRVVAWTLLHFFWQGALVAAALAAALTLLRRGSSQLRYGVACGALVAMAVLPVATGLWLQAAERTPGGSGVAAVHGSGSGEPMPAAANAGARAGHAVSTTAAAPTRLTVIEPVLPWLVGLWLAGVGALSCVHLVGWARVRRLRRQGVLRVEQRWRRSCARLARRLGIRRPVQLLASTRVAVPAVIGWLKPVVLFPASTFAGLGPRQLESILAHELAHVRRHDALINLLQVAIETLLFYHPAMWWASRQVRELREHCCDDLAVAVCGDRMIYARALADLEELRFATPVFALGADGGSLLERIRRLAGARSTDDAQTSGWLAPALAAIALAATATVLAFAGGPSLAQEEEIGIGNPNLLPPMVIAQVTDEEPAGSSMTSASEETAARLPSAESPSSQRIPAGAPAGSIEGRWMAKQRPERSGDNVWLQLKFRSSDHSVTHSMKYPAAELDGLGVGSDVRFELKRAAGTIAFTGAMDSGGLGSGSFTFTPDPELGRAMKGLGYGELSLDETFEAMLFDVTADFVGELADLGYDQVAFDRLLELRIHGVSPAYVRELADLGYQGLALQRLVEMRIHGAGPEFVREMAALGFDGLPAQKLVEMRIHGVSPEFIREMGELGYRDLPASRWVEMRIHGVSPDFVRELEGHGYTGVPARKLVELRIHGIDGDFLQRISARSETD